MFYLKYNQKASQAIPMHVPENNPGHSPAADDMDKLLAAARLNGFEEAAPLAQIWIERLAQAFVNLQRQPAAPPQQNAPQPSPLPNFESFSPSDTESGKFSRWYSRFQHFMALHCADWEDGRKISLLMTKLDGQAFEQFESSLLPGRVTDCGDFGEVVAKLRELFDAKRTLFMDRYQALQVQIQVRKQ